MANRIIKDVKKAKTLIENTIKKGQAFKIDMQSSLSTACYHVIQHGDVTLLNHLIVSTNDVVADNGHKKWVIENAGEVLKWTNEKTGFEVKEGKMKELMASPEAVLAYEQRFEESKPYYELTPAKAFTGMNVVAMLNAIVKKSESLAKAKDEKMNEFELSEEEWSSKIDLRGLTQVKLLLANLNAGTSEKVMDMSGTGNTGGPDGGVTASIH